jgi:hypothetical protein
MSQFRTDLQRRVTMFYPFLCDKIKFRGNKLNSIILRGQKRSHNRPLRQKKIIMSHRKYVMGDNLEISEANKIMKMKF